ncbi:MAG: hypothetical protein RL164_1057, partial [Bacteroidota bacterium]
IESKFDFFDKIFSFDRKDTVKNNRLIFNPLFFREEYKNYLRNENEQYKYILYHLGWHHSDRLSLIKKIADFCNKNQISYNFLLYTGFFNYLVQFFFGGELRGNRQFLIFRPLSAALNRKNILQSKVILDIAHPAQSGLTMRTIELIGMQKKIITTNDDIVNYDFYHPNNILIVNRCKVVIDIEFLDIDHTLLPSSIINQYSIREWFKRMF